MDELDVLVLTEIRVKEEEAISYQLKGFKQTSKCRVIRGGGGIMIFVKEKFHIENLEYNFEEAESLVMKICDRKSKMNFTVVAIYRAPDLKLDNFLSDLDFWLQNATKKDETVIMIGDLNICIKNKSNLNMKYLNTGCPQVLKVMGVMEMSWKF
uniref:Endonuclease/exonuclease/phosphatase domain-containing protein n=1 Tax=Cacopsylla melanoneura TaxID=428564 RepID=A0A8D8QDP6_9HEMI